MSRRCGVVDLRQYTVLPGQRETLIDLFDRHFADGQEAAGIHVAGQFRDLDDPDRFVWLRGFESFAARGEALPRFYYGPVWRAHRDAANATIADSGDALLLEPLYLGASYPRYGAPRAGAATGSVVAITIAYLAGPVTTADRDLASAVGAEFTATQAELIAVFTTHVAENNFPVLPLRDEHVLVWITRFPGDAAHTRHRNLLTASPTWSAALRWIATRSNTLPMQQLRLRPTAQSQLR
jgi:quinol monooxygenase YgiN